MIDATFVIIASWLAIAGWVHRSRGSDVGRHRARIGAWGLAIASAVVVGFAWGEVERGATLVVDAESALLAALAAAVTAFALSIAPRRELTRANMARMLVWTAGVQLFFHADHLAVLAGAWGCSCLPYFSYEGSPIRRASLRLTTASTLPLVVAVVWAAAEGATLSLESLHLQHGSHAAGVLLLVMLAAIARLGVAPLHSWIPRLARERPTQALVLASPLAGASLLLRVSDVSAEAFVADQPWLEALGLVSALYFALVAYGQREQFRSAWFLALSQVSLVFVALCASEPLSMHGGVVLLISETLAMAGYLACATLVRSRRGDVGLELFHGLGRHAPRLAGLAFVFGLTVVGLPFSLTFVAEDVIAQGLLVPHPWLATGFVVVTALNAIGMIRHHGRTYFGSRAEGASCPDIRSGTRMALVILACVVLLGGLFPTLIWTAEAHTLGTHAARGLEPDTE